MVWIVDRTVGAGAITRFGQKSKALVYEQGTSNRYMLGHIKGRMVLIAEFNDGWYIINYSDDPNNSFGFGPYSTHEVALTAFTILKD